MQSASKTPNRKSSELPNRPSGSGSQGNSKNVGKSGGYVKMQSATKTPLRVTSTPAFSKQARGGSKPVLGGGNRDDQLSFDTINGLDGAKPFVDPGTVSAIDDGEQGDLLTEAEIQSVINTIANNPNLTGPQIASLGQLLQADKDRKQQAVADAVSGLATALAQLIGGATSSSGSGQSNLGGSGDGGQSALGGGSAPDFDSPTTGGGGGQYEAGPVDSGAVGGSIAAGTGADVGSVQAEADDDEAPLQTKRYLHVRNRTGETLTVRLKLPGREGTWKWEFEPGEESDLSIDGERLTAKKVFIWAETATNQWDGNKKQALVVVAQPYRAETIETVTTDFEK
jgi:hypothetical protein